MLKCHWLTESCIKLLTVNISNLISCDWPVKSETCLDGKGADTSAIEMKHELAVLSGSQIFPCDHVLLRQRTTCNFSFMSRNCILCYHKDRADHRCIKKIRHCFGGVFVLERLMYSYLFYIWLECISNYLRGWFEHTSVVCFECFLDAFIFYFLEIVSSLN